MAAAKPLTKEAIALTEKKMGMSLDDIIKMSKNPSTKSNNNQKKQQRHPNKGHKVFNNAAEHKGSKVKQYMDSRSSVRQGFLAQRRTNFQGNNQFPLATEAARNTAAGNRNRGFNVRRGSNSDQARVGAPTFRRRPAVGASKDSQQQRGKTAWPKQKPKTLDSLFANMKEQRMRAFSQQNNYYVQHHHVQANGGSKRGPPWVKARSGY
ncbi:hypothetical protein ACFE04_007480 [Oxalis oulophora]